MNYEESRQYINETTRYGSVLGLDSMRELMRRLGDPQDALTFVHVAGTNGKGSVIAYLAAVLKEAGYQTGRYISPAVYTYRERMDVNGEMVSRKEFARHLTRAAQAADAMELEGLPHPTAFEIETAVAFLYFLERKCDIVVLETGLGGLLDATNVVKTTQVSVLTHIARDHTAYLGNTIGEIAANKAGIIKPGCTVVTAMQEPEAMEVIKKVCREQGSALAIADMSDAKIMNADYTGASFTYADREYQIAMAGLYQIDNAVLALKTLEIMNENGNLVSTYSISEEAQRQGLRKAFWHGRFEVIAGEPTFLVDGAHNPDGAARLAQSIENYFSHKKIYYIMGSFGDKEYDKVASLTAKYATEIIAVTTPRNGRALPGGVLEGKILADTVRKYNPHVTAAASLQEAVGWAYEKAAPEDVIIAFGTLAFIGEITNIVRERQKK